VRLMNEESGLEAGQRDKGSHGQAARAELKAVGASSLVCFAIRHVTAIIARCRAPSARTRGKVGSEGHCNVHGAQRAPARTCGPFSVDTTNRLLQRSLIDAQEVGSFGSVDFFLFCVYASVQQSAQPLGRKQRAGARLNENRTIGPKQIQTSPICWAALHISGQVAAEPEFAWLFFREMAANSLPLELPNKPLPLCGTRTRALAGAACCSCQKSLHSTPVIGSQ
jgi:hypothetical protein